MELRATLFDLMKHVSFMLTIIIFVYSYSERESNKTNVTSLYYFGSIPIFVTLSVNFPVRLFFLIE